MISPSRPIHAQLKFSGKKGLRVNLSSAILAFRRFSCILPKFNFRLSHSCSCQKQGHWRFWVEKVFVKTLSLTIYGPSLPGTELFCKLLGTLCQLAVSVGLFAQIFMEKRTITDAGRARWEGAPLLLAAVCAGASSFIELNHGDRLSTACHSRTGWSTFQLSRWLRLFFLILIILVL